MQNLNINLLLIATTSLWLCTSPLNAQQQSKTSAILDYDETKPLLPYLLQYDSIREHGLEQYSFFTKYIPGLNGGNYYTIGNDSIHSARIVMKNQIIKVMAGWIYGEGLDFFQDSSIAIEVKDLNKLYHTGPKSELKEWMVDNTYCYEIKTSKTNKDRLFKLVQRDFEEYFKQYKFTIEKKDKDCWVLISTGNNDKLKSKHPSSKTSTSHTIYKAIAKKNFSGLLATLRFFYHIDSPILFADRTKLDFLIDYELNRNNFGNIHELNKDLAKYNLKFVRRIEPVNILVIQDI